MKSKENIDYIAIIFNPNSTGDAPALAKKFKKDISSLDITTKLTPTKRAGHAVTLAKNISLKYKRPLIISVSGDGGYNEVINGAMQSKVESKKARPIVAVIGAGNANDHKRTVRADKSLAELITTQKAKPFDLLLLQAKGKKELERYAHSYIGLGLTSEAGNALNNEGKSRLQEIKAIVRTFIQLRPIKIKASSKSKQKKLDSLLFANINQMAKVATLSENIDIQDGKFEVIETKHRRKIALLIEMIKFAAYKPENPTSTKSYSFDLLTNASIQFDGEIEKLPKETKITVSSVHLAIDSYFDYD